MATTVNKDMIIYNETAQTSFLERRQDNIDVFNSSSNGAIILENEIIQGDFSQSAFYTVGGEMKHRDVNSTDKVTANKIGMSEQVGVKVPYKYGPYASTEEAFKRRARSPEEFAYLIGQDLADATSAGHLEYALGALTGAILSNSDMNVNGNIAVDGRKALTRAMRTFGDKFSRVALWVMNSDTYFDIIDDALTNQIYSESGVVIYGGVPGTLGKPVLVTDTIDPKLSFGLQRGAVRIRESQLPSFRLYDINDEENMAMGARAEGAFNIDILGYTYNKTKGENPNLEKLKAAASWKKYVASNKLTAGVLINLSKDEKSKPDGIGG